MHALRQIHKTLEPGGALLDLHPIAPFASVASGGRRLGALDETEFMDLVAGTEAGLDEVVRLGLFVPEDALDFDVIERFDDGEELIQRVNEEWFGTSVPADLAAAIRSARPPFDLREHVVFQRLRAS